MKVRSLARLFVVIVLGSLPLPELAQKKPPADEVRDAFLVSRPKVQPGPRPRPNQTKGATTPLGLGYTVYQRDASGQPVRVSMAKEFHKDDAVRVVVESNVSGYLYIFYTSDGGLPEMLFPDARLNGGDNRIAAHVPYEVPSSREPDPRLRWFVFDEKPAVERLYLVVTKQPLPNVPTGKALVAFCQANAKGCPWRPAEEKWRPLAAGADTPARENASAEFGQAMSAAESEALERGLGLKLDAPAPSVIRISQSPQAKLLVAVVALTHK